MPRVKLVEDNRVVHGIGYGYAHMTGIATATSDIIVCADCDGTYPVELLPEILQEMDKRDLYFASCTRYPDKNISPKLQFGVKILNLEIYMLYGYKIHDSLSGMWVFRRSIINTLHLSEGDWNLSPQIKLNARKYLGPHFGEIKISQRKRHGETKQRYVITGLRHFIWIAKNRFVDA